MSVPDFKWIEASKISADNAYERGKAERDRQWAEAIEAEAQKWELVAGASSIRIVANCIKTHAAALRALVERMKGDGE